jgi:transcriptional regulator with XRE-family HTH domain
MERVRSSVDELLGTDRGRCEFAKEELAFEATEKISELMEITGVSKSELARRVGKSKAYITQVLSGSRNLTLHTLAGLVYALGYKITINAVAADSAPVSLDALEFTSVAGDRLKFGNLGRVQTAPVLCVFPACAHLEAAA